MQSTYIEGPPQVDGRRYVRERHVDESGQVYEFEWLGSQAAQPVLDARAAKLDALIAEKRAAEVFVAGTKLPLTKLQFRDLFTATEKQAIDAFHAGFESHPALSEEQKAAIRTGLEDYRMASDIARPFQARVLAMLDLYVSLGLLTTERRDEIAA